jgi:hypothetical protein
MVVFLSPWCLSGTTRVAGLARVVMNLGFGFRRSRAGCPHSKTSILLVSPESSIFTCPRDNRGWLSY